MSVRGRVLAASSLLAGMVGLTPPVVAIGAGTNECAAVTYSALLTESLAALQITPPAIDRARAPISAILTGDLLPTEMRPGVALQGILDDLTRVPPATSDAITRLRSLTSVLGQPSGSACIDRGGGARDSLGRVYHSPAFANLDRPATKSFLQAIGDAILNAVAVVIKSLGTGGSALLGALILAALVALALWKLRSSSAAGRPPGIRAELPEAGDDPDLEWAEGLAAASRGEYREAVRRAFRSALVVIAVRGRLPVSAAWTTRELLDRAAGDGALIAALAPAAAGFDQAWYSGRSVDQAAWETARSRCAEIRRVAGRRAATSS